MKSLPATGSPSEDVLAALTDLTAHDVDWRSGRAFAYVYDAGREIDALAERAMAALHKENALDPTVFPSLRQIQGDLVAMVASHLNGGPESGGTVTSGGTESIMLAVKTARDRARAAGREGSLEVVLPSTAHPAHIKACQYLGLEPVVVDVDPATYRAIPSALAAAITERTVLLVGSAPSYPHGVVDPIEAIGAVAVDAGVPLHVDACVGGWLLPYWRRLGADVPAFDLSVPGVTSVSVDLHKYAFCPKGVSVLVHRDRAEAWAHQCFTWSGWAGYTLINPNVLSTRSGGPLAGAWAVLHHLGDAGYLDLAEGLRETTRRLTEGLAAINGVEVLAEPDLCLIAFRSTEVSPFHVADEMRLRGWYVQVQLGHHGLPNNLHLSVLPAHAPHVEAFLAALRESVLAAADLPDPMPV
ncbi:MAG: sphinganine-1-phosphate aldolase, partial [Myxococcota bacterium]